MPAFKEFTPAVHAALQAIRNGVCTDQGERETNRVREALRRYNEIVDANAKRTPLAESLGADRNASRLHSPGPKSALFSRLLAGGEPLPFPPPTSFSYPWYELIEKPGSHIVHSVGVAGGADHILLNQCAWKIASSNAAAQELLKLEQEFAGRTAQSEPALAPYWQRISDAYRANPLFLVSFGQWPAFILRVGRQKGVARRDLAERSALIGGRMDSMYGPLEFSGLDLNARVGAIRSHFNVQEHMGRLDIAGRSYQRTRIVDGYAPDRQDESADAIAVAHYLANPSAYDFVEFETDCWVLEKHHRGEGEVL